MKKILLIMLVIILIATLLVACNSSSNIDNDTEDTTTTVDSNVETTDTTNVDSNVETAEAESTVDTAEDTSEAESTVDTAEDTSEAVDANISTIKAFIYNGVEIKVNSDSEDIIAKLGEPNSMSASDSCMGDSSYVYFYSYNEVDITTYPKNGVDYIDRIWIRSDLLSTPEGASIGMDKSDIIKIYGEPSAQSDKILVYTSGGTMLQFDLNSAGKVTTITYKPAN